MLDILWPALCGQICCCLAVITRDCAYDNSSHVLIRIGRDGLRHRTATPRPIGVRLRLIAPNSTLIIVRLKLSIWSGRLSGRRPGHPVSASFRAIVSRRSESELVYSHHIDPDR